MIRFEDRAEYLAIIAVALAEQGSSEEDAQGRLAAILLELGEGPEILRLAADHVGLLPQPALESAEETERKRPIREMLGVRTAEEHLAASLVAHHWLLRMADLIG